MRSPHVWNRAAAAAADEVRQYSPSQPTAAPTATRDGEPTTSRRAAPPPKPPQAIQL